jgi:hypothetical protein
MACSMNLSKHLKNCYKTQIKKECFNMIFNFFANLMTFSSKKKSDQIFPFHIFFHICAKFQTKKKKKLVVTCVFEFFQSHCQMFNYMNFCIWASLEATILYNDSQHNIPALQGTANKRKHLDIWCKWSVWG